MGSGCPPSQPHRGPDHILGLFSQAKYLTKKTQAASVEAVKMLDEILLQLSVSSLGAGGQRRPDGEVAMEWGGESRVAGVGGLEFSLPVPSRPRCQWM